MTETAERPAAQQAAVEELERGLGPFDDPGWRADLAALDVSTRLAAVMLADDAVTIAALAARVPRSPGDERGGTPWTSFVREVAVVKKISDRAAHGEVALALALVDRHPRTLALLHAGAVPAGRARLLVEACILHTEPVLAAVEARVAPRLGVLPPWRIRQQIEQIALALDAEAAARQEAAATAGRTASKTALPAAQAEITLTGPAAVVQRWWDALTDQARALKAAGDPRSLGALRFDLAMTCDPRTGTGTDPLLTALGLTPPTPPPTDGAAGPGGPVGPVGPAWLGDARCSRPVQAHITVPAATALGLADEPGWLDGHGWISAPLSRQLLTVAELRKACLDPGSGQLLDQADRLVRPRLTATGLREAVRGMVLAPHPLRDLVVDPQPQHDPSPALRSFVAARDRYCDGPTGTQVPARRTDQDHARPWPTGPTAAWNLASRSPRTHQLKHSGWTAVRDAAGTTWTSPAGQVVHVPRFDQPPAPLPPDAALPDPDTLATADRALTRAPAWITALDEPEVSAPTEHADDTGDRDTTDAGNGWDDEPGF
jgi:hypothetical protein